MSAPKDPDDWDAVETRADLLRLIALLAAEWDDDEARRKAREAQGLWAGEGRAWAQGTPGAWLEAMHAWLESLVDQPRHAAAPPAPDLDTPSWKTFAFVLSASRRYE